MSKRKRDESHSLDESMPPNNKRVSAASGSSKSSINIQIITGSYERVLHGIHSTLPTGTLNAASAEVQATFEDTFLFTAHTSSIRCLALSPPSNNPKLILASGSSDGLINLYSLSTIPPSPHAPNSAASTNIKLPLSPHPRNRELGSLTTHTSSITTLSFPSRSKLLSASSDNTIAITRTRDWTAFSTIKAPIPKLAGRPSGDTAAPGEVPAGINDFAVHPSMKLMLTVGKGEKCMRLWNLVTGKKAGVLSFSKDMLQEVGEGRYGTGEGRRVLWSPDGEEFVVGFERAGVLFGLDCKPKGKIVPVPGSKICQMSYLPPSGGGDENGARRNVLAVSTEDGRVVFFDTKPTAAPPTPPDSPPTSAAQIPLCTIIGQLGGRSAGVRSRIKDFEMLKVPGDGAEGAGLALVTGSSDGIVRIWALDTSQLAPEPGTARQVGNLLGLCETGNRITCLKAFVMTGVAPGVDGDEEGGKEWKGVSGKEGSNIDSESDHSE